MDSQTNIPTQSYPAAHVADQPCRGCGASVAEDQRYCLGCGYRRPEKALPFAGLGAAAVAAPVAAKHSKAKQAISPALAVAIVCLSVLFLGTGVLVGRSAGGSQQVAAAPEVVTTVAADAGTEAGATPGTGSTAKAKAKSTAGRAAAAPAPGTKVLDKGSVQALTACSTPAECSKKSAKLPKTILTPGKLPPTDNKAPAGGADGTTFN